MHLWFFRDAFFCLCKRKFHEKAVLAVPALGPDAAVVFLDNAFCDGKTQTVAVIHAACFVYAVKALENLFQILSAEFRAAVSDFQQAAAVRSKSQQNERFGMIGGILLRVIQKNFNDLLGANRIW